MLATGSAQTIPEVMWSLVGLGVGCFSVRAQVPGGALLDSTSPHLLSKLSPRRKQFKSINERDDQKYTEE